VCCQTVRTYSFLSDVIITTDPVRVFRTRFASICSHSPKSSTSGLGGDVSDSLTKYFNLWPDYAIRIFPFQHLAPKTPVDSIPSITVCLSTRLCKPRLDLTSCSAVNPRSLCSTLSPSTSRLHMVCLQLRFKGVGEEANDLSGAARGSQVTTGSVGVCECPDTLSKNLLLFTRLAPGVLESAESSISTLHKGFRNDVPNNSVFS